MCGTVFRSFLIFTVISCLLSMVLYQIFVLSAWLTFVFVMFTSVTRTEKKIEKKKIAVGVCGTVFRSFLIFTVISCLVCITVKIRKLRKTVPDTPTSIFFFSIFFFGTSYRRKHDENEGEPS